ncbi:MAG TPA: acyltransferase [Candidatus Binatia bacterium]
MSKHNIASLDGLRAVSITLVVISHLSLPAAFPGLPCARCWTLAGDLGVQMFFVISGFLITSLLLKEIDQSGSISLSRFYYRRTLRIFPPFYFMLAFLIIVSSKGFLQIPASSLVHAATYTTNYLPEESLNLFTRHTWSLAVEEQFYLLWPIALVLLGKLRGLKLAVVALALCPIFRLSVFLISREFFNNSLSINNHFESVADSIAVGCVLAGVPLLEFGSSYTRLLKSKAFFLVPLVGLVIHTSLRNQTQYYFLVYILIGYTLVNLSIALCVHWSVTHRESMIGRLLNSPPLVFVGVMSYSIYLWQQPVLFGLSLSIPLKLGVLLTVCTLSYYLIERPTLRVRRRVEMALFFTPQTLQTAERKSQ